ncbi:MAG: hypothetical protein ACOYXN_09255 [Acidobacteriota bacterium]
MARSRPTAGHRRTASAARRLSALGALWSAAAVPAQDPPFPEAFVHVTVVNPETGPHPSDQTVLVREGRIEAWAHSNSVPIPVEAVRLNGSGLLLVPGLVDAPRCMRP